MLLYSPSHEDAVNILYSACRQCYSSGWVGDVYPFSKTPISKKEELLKRVVSSGHHSVLEHVSFTFAIKDLSRAAQQQLTRHRIGVAYSVQSSRYNNVEDMGYYTPDSIKDQPQVEADYNRMINLAVKFYQEMIDEDDIPKEDARGVLPLNWYSNLVMTMNVRELLHFFNERLCINAQKEIRDLAKEMLKICQKILPEIFSAAGPKCFSLGYCNEGTRSCHRFPLKEEVFNIYNKFKDFK